MKKILLISLMLTISLLFVSCGEEKVAILEEKQIEVTKEINSKMKDNIKEISDKVVSWDITDEEVEDKIMDSINNSKTVQTQLEKTKEQTPKMVEWMKVNKKCIEAADSKIDAKKCMEKANKLAKKLDLPGFFIEDENEDFDWNSKEKELILSDLNEALEQREKMLPCIEKAEKITDLMQCGMDN